METQDARHHERELTEPRAFGGFLVFAVSQRKPAKPKAVYHIGKNGAGYTNRTRDPLITNQVLYQLS